METNDSSEIRFVGHPDAETYLALFRIVRPQQTWSGSGLVLISLVVVVAIFVLMSNGVPPLAAVALISIIIGMFSLLPRLTRMQIEKRLKRAYTEAMQKLSRTGNVSQKGIHIQFADGQTKLDWSHFDHTAEIDGAVGLCKDRELVDAISRSMFETSEAWIAARKIVLVKVCHSSQIP